MRNKRSDGMRAADVAAVVDDCGLDTAREVLDPITDEGIVTRSAVEAAVSDTSKLLATAETRVELAGNAHEDAIEAAERVADLPVVRTRTDAFTERLSAVESRVSELRPDLGIPADVLERPRSAYDLAVTLRDVATTAQGIIGTADNLSFDIEQFRSWLDRPSRRYDEFEEDVDLVEESVTELETAAETPPSDVGDPAAGWADDPAVRWADATMRAGVLSLLVEDLRVELRDLRIVAERTGDPFRPGLVDRLEQVGKRVSAIESTLDHDANRGWLDRFGDDIAAFEKDLATFDPPVDWAAIDESFEDHRPDGIETATTT